MLSRSEASPPFGKRHCLYSGGIIPILNIYREAHGSAVRLLAPRLVLWYDSVQTIPSFRRCVLRAETERLLQVLKTEAFQRGNFILASGRASTYYIDCRMATLHPEGSYLVGKVIFERIKDDAVDAVGGLTMGADPIATAVALVSYLEGKPIPAFIARKEPKTHGRGRWVEGPLKPGSRVVIVDDVITTGESALKAISAVEQEGCTVLKVVALVDRLEGGREALTERGYTVESIFTIEDFGV